jgi:hypothetical protein
MRLNPGTATSGGSSAADFGAAVAGVEPDERGLQATDPASVIAAPKAQAAIGIRRSLNG